jgi:hypothetical protein
MPATACRSNGVNYLLPVTADVRGREDLRRDSLSANLLTSSSGRPHLRQPLLDAASTNPEAELRRGWRSARPNAGRRAGASPHRFPSPGDDRLRQPRPGQVALYGPPGLNSPFAEGWPTIWRSRGWISSPLPQGERRVRRRRPAPRCPGRGLPDRPTLVSPGTRDRHRVDAITALNRALDAADPLLQAWPSTASSGA